MFKPIRFYISYGLLVALCFLASLCQAATNTIDVLFVYTQGVNSLYNGDPTTRFNQLIQVTNQIYVDSGVDTEIRLAGTLMVNYTDDNSAETALNAITYNRDAAFAGVAAARETFKADMVVFYRPYKAIHGSCGIAWTGGNNGSIGNEYKPYMYSHVAINSCGDFVTAHELGHNMGLKHSRSQDGVGGVLPYALGYGVNGSFTTIMAYQNIFNVDYWTGKVYKFSNPDIQCKNQPCGIVRTNSLNGSDARYALNITTPQIANFYIGTPNTSSRSSVSSVSVSSSSSRSSSSLSSVNSSDATRLKNQVASARANHSAATLAFNENKLAISQKTNVEKEAKTALNTATKNLDTATKNYQKAVTAYNGLMAKVAPLSSQLNTALSAYNSATTSADKSSKLKAYNTLVAKYNALVEQITLAVNTVNSLQSEIAPLTNQFNNATSAYNTAVTANTNEKAKTTALNAAVVSALTALKTLEEQYNTALKLCRCTV